MTIQQLEYLVALDRFRHFVNAAAHCGVSQPTLSAMVQKLEEELDVIIFDRKSHPMVPTEVGAKIIDSAKIILSHVGQLKEGVLSEKGTMQGNLRLSVIPTVAPYLLPQLFVYFRSHYPSISLHVSEMRTAVIINQLRRAEIDMAILATPLQEPDLLEIPLYYEKFVAYISPQESLATQNAIPSKEMPTEHMWVLQEGHCLRNQVFNFCSKLSPTTSLYEAGSIDTLIRIVDVNGGYTIIPELHLPFLDDQQKQRVHSLVDPLPVREISLVVRQDYVRERLLNLIADGVKSIIPDHMLDTRLKKFAIKL